MQPARTSLWNRLLVPLVALIGTHVVGTAGYWVLWRDRQATLIDALYMTFMTVTTVGFAEVYPLDTAGRFLTMLIAGIGIGTLFYSFTVTLDWVTSDQTRAERRRRKMQQAIDALSGHFILAGIGRVGREAALELLESKSELVIVDPSESAERFCEEHRVLFVRGDASDNHVLERAGIRRARGLIVTTANDATNLYVVLSARLLNPTMFIACRAVDEVSKPKLERAGANRAISPYAIGGRRLAHLLMSPRVVDFFDTALHRGNKALTINDVLVAPGSKASGKALGALNIRNETGATILAVLREGQPHPNPAMEFAVETGDHILALGTDEQLEKLDVLLAP